MNSISILVLLVGLLAPPDAVNGGVVLDVPIGAIQSWLVPDLSPLRDGSAPSLQGYVRNLSAESLVIEKYRYRHPKRKPRNVAVALPRDLAWVSAQGGSELSRDTLRVGSVVCVWYQRASRTSKSGAAGAPRAAVVAIWLVDPFGGSGPCWATQPKRLCRLSMPANRALHPTAAEPPAAER